MFAGFSNTVSNQKTATTFRAPVAVTTLEDRLAYELRLDPNVIRLIMDTKYESPTARQIPLFAIYPYEKVGDAYILDYHEIVEMINVFYLMQDDPNNKNPVESFADHIANVALNKKHKLAENLLITEDSVFQAPHLEKLREEENMKEALANRRGIPTQGRCVRKGCKSNLLYRRELTLRAGDESTVWFYTCAMCDNTWKI